MSTNNIEFVVCRVCNARVKGVEFDKHFNQCACRRYYECILCHKKFDLQSQFRKHISSCSQGDSSDGYTCTACNKPFRTRTMFNRHIRTCSQKPLNRCIGCAKMFSSVRGLRCHTKQCSTCSQTKQFRCHQCNKLFANRKLLYLHKNSTHHDGDRNLLQDEPWYSEETRRPWTNEHGQMVNEPLFEVYNMHRRIILRAHENDADNNNVQHTYNFPLEDRVDPESIDFKSHMQYIFQREQCSFKVNVSFGIILQHVETGEYRYFIAYRNTHIFERPLLVTNSKTMKRVLNKIRRDSLSDHVLLRRPNTKWKPVFITNVVYSMYLSSFTLGCEHNSLPSWLRKKKCIALTQTCKRDTLCAFRCLAYHRSVKRDKVLSHTKYLERETLKLFEKWQRECNSCRKLSQSSFHGLRVPDDVAEFERIFNVRVNVFRLLDRGYSSVPVYLSKRDPDTGGSCLNLNCYEGHLIYITNLPMYTKRYKCRHCDKCFRNPWQVRRHEKSNCAKRTSFTLPGGYFTPSRTIFEKLNDLTGFLVPENDRCFSYFIMFDFESLLLKCQSGVGDSNTKWTHHHHPVSVSVCSNVPDYEEPKCIVSVDTETLLTKMVNYMTDISNVAKSLTEKKLQTAIRYLQDRVEEIERRNLNTCEITAMDADEGPSVATLNRLSHSNVYHTAMKTLQERDLISVRYNEWDEISEEDVQTPKLSQWSQSDKLLHAQLKRMRDDLLRYCSQVPVLGFNSSKYDLNLVKGRLAKILGLVDSSVLNFVIKRNNQYICMTTEKFKILDLTQYLPPGTSYANFLRTFKVEQRKGFLPYEYMDSPERLDETHLPPIEAFWSTLKNVNTLEDPMRRKYEMSCRQHSDMRKEEILAMMNVNEVPKTASENYEFLKHVWYREGMQTVKDLLIWYNNLDVKPGIEAVTRLKAFYWNDIRVDIFKDAVSVPGVARKLLFQSAAEKGSNFSLFDRANSDLYEVVKDGICGGPSILFCRYHCAGETYLRGNKNKVCGNCIGYDCNSLYLSCLGQELPVSYFIRWLPCSDGCFKSRKSEKYTIAYDWLEWVAFQNNITIRHKLNCGREKRIGPYYVDGFHAESNTCYEFYGCYWHQCIKSDCKLYKHMSDDGVRVRYNRTLDRENYIKSQGYKIVSMWECEYRRMCQTNQQLADFVQRRQHNFSSRHSGQKVDENTLLQAVQNDTFFGMMEVDIHVPDHLYDHFAEMSPLFVTCKVPFSKIGKHMQDHVDDQGLNKQPRTLLVGGMKAKEMLIATPLLKWYLHHGLVVTKVHQAVEYTRERCFQAFTERVTEARRIGDADPELATLADLHKLVGNSGYGGILMNQANHQDVFYVHGDDRARMMINDPRFISLSSLDENDYEVQRAKKSIKLNLPIVLGFFVLQYAKQRMLEFYYDLLDVYVCRSDFELLQTDTDSLYFAISGKCVLDVVKPEKKQSYLHAINGFCNCDDIAADGVTHFLPRTCCDAHKKRDKRTPGLFKLESQGSEMVSLNSKTYALHVDDKGHNVKISSKGLNKHCIPNPMDAYIGVLRDK